MKEKYKTAIRLDGRSQQWIAEKFRTSRQVVNAVINKKSSTGVYGKSKQVKDYLDELVKRYEL